MSKRLQIVMDNAEYREFQKVARRHRVTLSAWVRDVLRLAGRQEPRGDADRKLAAIRAAARHDYPTADVEEMLAQIEGGYLGGEPR